MILESKIISDVNNHSYEGQEFNNKPSIGRLVTNEYIIEGELRKASAFGFVRQIKSNKDYYLG